MNPMIIWGILVILGLLIGTLLKPVAGKIGKFIRKKLLLTGLLVSEKDIRKYMKSQWTSLEKFCSGSTEKYYLSYEGKYSIRPGRHDTCRFFKSVFYHSEITKKSEMKQYDFACPVNETDDSLEIDTLAELFSEAMTYPIFDKTREWAHVDPKDSMEVRFRDYFLSPCGQDLFTLGKSVNKCDDSHNPAIKIIANNTGATTGMSQRFQIMIRLDWVMRLVQFYQENLRTYMVTNELVRDLLHLDPIHDLIYNPKIETPITVKEN